ncbi:MAG: hypothetical protein P8M25_19170 [Paracoccaceae bacterium]|nr:hypothetical protein [Paracoccaceae bacterium]
MAAIGISCYFAWHQYSKLTEEQTRREVYSTAAGIVCSSLVENKYFTKIKLMACTRDKDVLQLCEDETVETIGSAFANPIDGEVTRVSPSSFNELSRTSFINFVTAEELMHRKII